MPPPLLSSCSPVSFHSLLIWAIDCCQTSNWSALVLLAPWLPRLNFWRTQQLCLFLCQHVVDERRAMFPLDTHWRTWSCHPYGQLSWLLLKGLEVDTHLACVCLLVATLSVPGLAFWLATSSPLSIYYVLLVLLQWTTWVGSMWSSCVGVSFVGSILESNSHGCQ